MKFGVVVLPGSNCDHDAIHVTRDILGCDVEALWHKDTDLRSIDCIIIPGGFSFGDYLRAGALAQFSPVMEAVRAHATRGGYVIGICNGFQVLTESRMLPGALLRNKDLRFICREVFLRVETRDSALSNGLQKGDVLSLPIAHGEGNYFADDATLDELEANDQIIFRYSTRDGNISEEANPNGSRRNIAGICNRQRNVYGMMPHPERHAEPLLGNADGLRIFRSVQAALSVVS